MTIPFPERFPINRVAIFAGVLFAIQMAEGTEVYFGAGCVAFILIAALAFNAAGGLTRAAGAYVFAYSILVFIVGISYKAFLGEPAQSNLLDPHTDIVAYVATITALFAAVMVSRRFQRKAGLLQNMLKESDMYRSSIGCIVFGVAGAFLIAMLGQGGNKLQSAFAQLNWLIPLGIIIGVTYEIRRSGGNRCTNLPITLGAIYFFFLGVIGFSKQGMLSPLYSFLLPVCALRYRLSTAQILSFVLAIFVIFHYLTPYSQYGRTQVATDSTFGQRFEVAARLLSHPEETRHLYLESEAADTGGLSAYYNTPQGFWERLQFISADDKLINFTTQGHIFGLLPLKYALYGIVPHVFWPNKPDFNPGYTYVLEINGETPDPTGPEVGIAFSPTAESYHLAGWTGILVIAPLLWCVLFIIFDSILGDLRATPWGLLALALISHVAPEGGILGTISLCSTGVEVIVFCAFFATWFAPSLATVVLGSHRPVFEPEHRMPPTQILPSSP